MFFINFATWYFLKQQFFIEVTVVDWTKIDNGIPYLGVTNLSAKIRVTEKNTKRKK